MQDQLITLKDIQDAAERIKPYAHRTPVMTCSALDAMIGARLYFKCENFQKVGAFKFRGATNAVFSLTDEEAANGVATVSSGNHAQALSLAARNRGIKAYIVMPNVAPKVKVEAVRGYGGEVIFCEPTLRARREVLEDVVKKTGAMFVHPSDDLMVIAGQGTSAMELIEDVNDLDIIVTPVGGGGLLSGTAYAAHYFSPDTRVIAAEPKQADDAYQSFKSGKFVPSADPVTIADGLLTSLGPNTFKIILEHVSDIITVTEENIIAGMRHTWERMKVIAEPSGAVPFGGLLQHRDIFKGKKIGVIISGGNVDLEKLPWLNR